MVVEKKNIILTILIVLALFTSFAQSETLYLGLTTAKRLYFFSIMAAILLCVTFILVTKKSVLRISFNCLDVSILLYLLYSLVRLIFTEFVPLYDDQFISLVLLTGFYFIVKQVATVPSNKETLIAGLLVAGLSQGIYGLLQLYGFLPSNNQYFKITGSFGNPDGLAGYIVCVIPLALGLYLSKDIISRYNKVLKKLGLLTVIVLSLALAATRIRGGWLAALVGCGIVLYSMYQSDILKYITNKLRLSMVTVGGILLMILLVSFLYTLKPDSANGRLFIWKISLPMVLENPLFGIGFNRYAVEYNSRQADYFAQGLGTEYEKFIAGNVNRAHNEYIEILVELGIVGFIIFLFIVFNFVRVNNSKSEFKEDVNYLLLAKASLVSIFLFSLTSFPLHILSSQVSIFLILGIISSYKIPVRGYIISASISKYATTVFSLIILSLCYYTFTKYRNYKRWNDAVRYTYIEDFFLSKKIFRELLPNFKCNGDFLMNYGGTLLLAGEYNYASSLLEESRKYLTTQNLFTALGNCYSEIGDYSKAEKYYLHAVYMVNHKLFPKYLLVKLYERSGQKEKLITLAKEIIMQKEKISSIANDQIKAEIKTLIENSPELKSGLNTN